VSNKYRSAKRGIFIPKNPKKWIQKGKIIFRSNIERKYFNYFDVNPSVTSIASERVVIPYFDKASNKLRKYYVDLIVQFRDRNGNIKTKLIEIKHSSESIRPKKPKRVTNSYKQKVMTWITNECKWNEAKNWCSKKGIEFIVLTEKNL